MTKIFKKSNCPDSIQYLGRTLKMYIPKEDERKETTVTKLQSRGIAACIVEVLHRNLKGKTDLHGQPYKPSRFVYSEYHTEEQIAKYLEEVEFWKKCFSPRSKFWQREKIRELRKPTANPDEKALIKIQGLKEIF